MVQFFGEDTGVSVWCTCVTGTLPKFVPAVFQRLQIASALQTASTAMDSANSGDSVPKAPLPLDYYRMQQVPRHPLDPDTPMVAKVYVRLAPSRRLPLSQSIGRRSSARQPQRSSALRQPPLLLLLRRVQSEGVIRGYFSFSS